jgi:hypothetical protein
MKTFKQFVEEHPELDSDEQEFYYEIYCDAYAEGLNIMAESQDAYGTDAC